MRKILFKSLAMGLLSFSAFSQSYSFTQRTGAYADLSNDTELTGGLTWDDPNLTIPMGFNFNMAGQSINTLFLYDGLGGFLDTDTNFTGVQSIIMPYGPDIIDRAYDFNMGGGQSGGLSPISYVIEGAAGNMICKIQWKNAGFYGEINSLGTSSDFVNFQAWFYEATNTIEFHYGPNTIASPGISFEGDQGPFVGLVPQYDTDNDSLLAPAPFLTGIPTAAAVAFITDLDANIPTLTGSIPNSTIYSFGPQIGLDENQKSIQLDIYPNPSSNFIRLTNKSDETFETIEITNINGQLIRTFDYADRIDISTLSNGLYTLTLRGNASQHSQKFLKK